MKKIGIDGSAFTKNQTGIGNYLYEMVNQIIIKRNDIEFVIFSNDEIYFADYPNLKKKISYPKRRGPAWQNTQLRSMIIKEGIDLYWGTNGLLPIFLPKKIVKILTIHDLVYKFAGSSIPFLSRIGRKYFQSFSASIADHIITVSRSTAADVKIEYNKNVDSIISPSLRSQIKRASSAEIEVIKRKYKIDDNYILILGTIEPRKNIKNFLSAYLKFSIEQKNKIPQLVIAGGKGWLDKDINLMINYLVSKKLIKNLGFVPDSDISQLYSGCYSFFMPSLYEGFGMPILEAQMCGAPVIHGPHSSMREASNNLGLVMPTDVDGMISFFAQFADNSLPLVCRLQSDNYVNLDSNVNSMIKIFDYYS
jgi:glycosyltransferase involved in cell wall biosynthesis